MARLTPRVLALPLLFTCAACTTVPGPVDTAEAYARALGEGRWEDAAALSGQTPAELQRAYATGRSPEEAEALRRRRAGALANAQTWAPKDVSGVELTRTEGGWRIHDAPPGVADEQAAEAVSDTEAARSTLRRFLEASEGGDFGSAWALLAAPLRARYTPERLASDFEDEPLSRERLQRARLAVAKEPILEGSTARFPIGESKAVVLVKEPEGWRVEALE